MIRRDGLVTRLILATVFIGAITGIVGAAVLHLSARAALVEQVEEINEGIARRFAVSIDDRLQTTISTLRLLATSERVIAMDPRASGEFAVAMRVEPDFDRLVLFDAEGRPVAASASRQLLRPAEVEPAPELTSDVADGVIVDVVARGVSPQLRLVVPVEDPPGHPIGALAAHLPVETIATRLLATRPGDDVRALLIASDGRIAAHPDRSLVVQGAVYELPEGVETGDPFVMEQEDGRVLVATADTTVFPGTVIVEQDERSAIAPVSSTTRRLVYILLAVIATVVVAASAVARWRLRPLESLDAAVSRFRAGDRTARANEQGGGEIGSVAREFNRMAESLDRQIAQLEHKSAALQLLHGVTAAANAAPDVETALGVALSRVGEFSGWTVGHVYLATPAGSEDLQPSEMWHGAGDPRFAALREATVTTNVRRGEGLLGRVMDTGQATWASDLRKDPAGFIRVDAALDAGLVAALAFPIFVRDEVVGVLEFLSEQSEDPDPELVDVMTQIGFQLGRVVERQRIAKLREGFIANAAHELRTPLTTVLGYADLLTDHDGFTPGEIADLRQALDRQASRLRALVSNLLDFSRIQHGGLDVGLEAVPVLPLVEELLETTDRPEGKRIEVSVAPELGVLADRPRLDQIVTNLLTNAYRYGGRHIRIEARRDGPWVDLSVWDDGAGVPQELVPVLFEPFTRGAHGTGDGSGLGLAIVRMLARAQGGNIVYENGAEAAADEGSGRSGCRFTVRLRRAR